jgi:hypothetical protein
VLAKPSFRRAVSVLPILRAHRSDGSAQCRPREALSRPDNGGMLARRQASQEQQPQMKNTA